MIKNITKLVALMFLSQQAIASESASECNASVSDNCPCLVTYLKHQLGADKTHLLFETWRQALNPNEAERHTFFYSRAKEVQATILTYGQFKTVIAMQCGTLNLPSDGMD